MVSDPAVGQATCPCLFVDVCLVWCVGPVCDGHEDVVTHLLCLLLVLPDVG